MIVEFRGTARRLYFAKSKVNEGPLVDVWEYLEAIRDGMKPCPCPVGRSFHAFIVCANADIFAVTVHRPAVDNLVVDEIEKLA